MKVDIQSSKTRLCENRSAVFKIIKFNICVMIATSWVQLLNPEKLIANEILGIACLTIGEQNAICVFLHAH